jgi:hypothetical protein
MGIVTVTPTSPTTRRFTAKAMDLITQAADVCVAALLGAFTVVGVMLAYFALCAVCKQIARTLWDDNNIDDILPR